MVDWITGSGIPSILQISNLLEKVLEVKRTPKLTDPDMTNFKIYFKCNSQNDKDIHNLKLIRHSKNVKSSDLELILIKISLGLIQ